MGTGKRYLGVHLFYTDDCPEDYEPAGFGAANDEYIYFPIDQEWRRESITFGSADSGYHTSVYIYILSFIRAI